MALVPVRKEGAPPTSVPRVSTGPEPSTVMYVLWYGSIALILAGAAASAWIGDASFALYILAALVLGLSGLALAIHTLVRPTEGKFRHALLALGALVASIVASGPMQAAGTEIRLAGQVAELQPVANELIRFGRLREWRRGGGTPQSLNGYQGTLAGDVMVSPTDSTGRTLDYVLGLSGTPRAEYDRVVRMLENAGIAEAQVDEGGVALRTEEHFREVLLFLPPGRAWQPANRIFGQASWGSMPLGGGWYHLR